MPDKLTLDDKLFLDGFKADQTSHLVIRDPEVCRRRCITVGRPCTAFCPAGVYEWSEEEDKILVSYEGCLECGACRIGCPFGNIEWRYPRGGFGVSYKLG